MNERQKELVDRYFDGDLDEAEAAELCQWLSERPDNAEYLALRGELHAGLRRSLRRRAEFPAIQQQPVAAQRRSVRTPGRFPRWATFALAVAACLLIALGVWQFWPAKTPGPVAEEEDPLPQQPSENPKDNPNAPPPLPAQPAGVQLAQWQITPTGDAQFEVLSPAMVRLDRGELLVESKENEAEAGTRGGGQSSLRIKTPQGEAVAAGTKFYIGAHTFETKEESPMLKSMTRVLVLAGVVTLTTGLGSVEGTRGDLLAAEPNAAPTKLVVQANSDFAWKLYRQLAKENAGENLFFSPYSVSSALAMTAEGARGVTAQEMGDVLGFPGGLRRMGDDDQLIPWETSLIHTGMSDLNAKLNGGGIDPERADAMRAQIEELRAKFEAKQAEAVEFRKQRKPQERFKAQREGQEIAKELNALSSQVDQYELAVANALWGERTYPFKQAYVDTINKHYETGGVFPVDFKTNYEAERAKINAWVEGKTQDRIKDLLPKGSIDNLTRLVLTNAIYFKGDWSVPFEEKQTKDRPFTHADGSKSDKAIMFAPELDVARYGAFNADGSLFATPVQIRRGQEVELYPGDDGFSIVELPYKGDDLSMVVIAPNKPDGLAKLEEKLSPASVNDWIAQLKQRDTHVYLPKFKLEAEYTLGDADAPATLQKMGMQRAFVDPRKSDGARFDGMCESTDPRYRLYITKVLHKAFVEVNEKGTEAAAATAVVMAVPTSVPSTLPFTPEFKADRPFIYLVREKSTGSILFVGRMLDPVVDESAGE